MRKTVQYQDFAAPVLVPVDAPNVVTEWTGAQPVMPPPPLPRRRIAPATICAEVVDIPDLPAAPAAPEIVHAWFPSRLDRAVGLPVAQQQFVAWNPETPPTYVIGSAQAFYPLRLDRARGLLPSQHQFVAWNPFTPAPVITTPELALASVFPSVLTRRAPIPANALQHVSSVVTPPQPAGTPSGGAVVYPTRKVRRIRRAPYLTGEDRRFVFHHTFHLDLEVGVGTTDSPSPIVYLRFSDDRGKTWSNPIPADIGARGAYKTLATWHRLGRARERIYEIDVTESVRLAIVAAYFNLTVGKR